MPKRWSGLVNKGHRYTVALQSWVARKSLVHDASIGVGLLATLRKRLGLKLNNGLGIKLHSRLKQIGRFVLEKTLGISTVLQLRLQARLQNKNIIGARSRFRLRLRGMFYHESIIGISHKGRVNRRRTMKPISHFGVRASARLRKAIRLAFRDERLINMTVGILKAFTVQELKTMIVKSFKQEKYLVPQFRIEFSANLQKG